MGIITTLLERRAIAPPEASRGTLFSVIGGRAAAGVHVTEEGSLQSTAVYACVRIIAESIASLPLVIYRRDGRRKERAVDHPLYEVLHDQANPEMTAFDWRETTFGHVLLWGNGYSEKEYDARGQLRALWPLRPDQAMPVRENGRLWLDYRLPNGKGVRLPWWRVHHVRGLSGDGLVGFSPIAMTMQAVGLTLAAERYGAAFYGNGARPGGMITHPGKLSDKARDRLKDDFAERHQGLSNAHRTAILEEGMKFEAVGIPPEEAQFLETRKFQVTEIARIFRVPPHMLADLERATFSNIEHQSLEFVIHTLRPWLVRHEQRIRLDMIQPDERATLYARYIVEGLLRGDQASRYAAYQSAINTGFMTRNEARELEDWNPLDGLDEPLVPLNMSEAGQSEPIATKNAKSAKREHDHAEMRMAAEVSEPETWERRAEQVGTARQAAMRRMVRLWEDAAGRAVKREAADIRRAIPRYFGKRSADDFMSWLASFYEEMRGWLPDYFKALMLTYAEQMFADVSDELGDPVEVDADALAEWVDAYLANVTSVWTVGGERQLRTLILDAEDEEQAAAAVQQRMDDWETTKPGKTALEQAFEAGNALAILGYVTAGVATLRWMARGESCPLCKKLDGRRIPIAGSFVDEGDTVEAEGVDPLPIVRKIKHGPLHGGCLAGDSLVLSIHGITAASKRWFDGEVVTISIANGHKLTCTPNHPILTWNGWVAAGLLNKRDDVICHGGRQWRNVVDWDHEDMPARIQDVAETFGRDPEMVAAPMPVTAEHFHGDGEGSDVAIIWANRLLMDGFNATLMEHHPQCPLITGDIETTVLSSLSRQTLFREGLFTAFGGDMSGGGLGFTLPVSHLAGAYQSGVAVAAGRDAILQQDATDGNPRYAEFERQGIFGLPAEIFADEIIDVQRSVFHGHVYNLQTETGWYTAESIITHNCDCVVVAG